MKIGILTFHYAHNSGAVLQAYALQKKIASLGHEVYIIDYIPDYIYKNQYKKYKIVPNNKQLPLGKKIAISFRLIYNFFSIANRITAYEKFLSKKLNLTHKVKKEELNKLEFDAYILGSDQIWNEKVTGGFEGAYFGEFVDKNRSKIITYSASLGANQIDDEEKFRELLKKIDKISLREAESVDYVAKYTDKNVVNVLDPTLLINQKEWEEEFKLTSNPKNYILFLALLQRKGDKALAFAKKLAKKHKLKVVLSVSFKNITKLKSIINTPYNFLDLIKNSKYIITDSFHGVVFSIIFKKEFFVIKRDCNVMGKTNCSFRIENLLNKLHIKGRFIGENVEEINYDEVYDILKIEQGKSKQYLIEALEQ